MLKDYEIAHQKQMVDIRKVASKIDLEEKDLILYGKYKMTNNEEIGNIAPNFYEEVSSKYGEAPYGLVEYQDSCRMNVKAYWVLYYDQKDDMEEFIIPKSKWIQLRVNSQEPEDIQENSRIFYQEFLPNSKYNFRDLPELEYYHDDVTDFLIPIED